MDRITPNDGAAVELKDHEAYTVLLAKLPEIVEGSEQFPAKRLEVTWQLADGDPDDTFKDWLSLKLGQMPGGDVAKLRQLVNAVAGRAEADRVEWFDPTTFEYGYTKDGPAAGQLTVGLAVVIRGKAKPKQSDGSMRYRITTYQPAARTAAAPPPPSDGAYQYTDDGKHRWKPGMAAWEPVPAATAPPVPPAAPAPPPPPPTAAADDSDQIPF